MEPFEPRDPARTDLSAARLDRLRNARVPASAAPPRAVLAWTLTAALLAFALGLIANPWFERSVRSHLPGFAPTLSPTAADLAAVEARVAALEARPAAPAASPSPGPAEPAANERVARVEGSLATLGAAVPATEARIDKVAADLAALTARIDATAGGTAAALDSVTATAARAQALLVAAAVRQQLAAGQRLGLLDLALRRDFAGRAAPQVEAVAALGAAPVTAASLRAGLTLLRPTLTGTTATTGVRRGWWETLRDGVAQFAAQPAGGATGAAAHVDRADQDLGAGDVAAAAAEIAALPPALRPKTAAWLAAATRYQAGWRGMAALETLLLDPPPAAPGPPGAAVR